MFAVIDREILSGDEELFGDHGMAKHCACVGKWLWTSMVCADLTFSRRKWQSIGSVP